jgi:hypothetical protein
MMVPCPCSDSLLFCCWVRLRCDSIAGIVVFYCHYVIVGNFGDAVRFCCLSNSSRWYVDCYDLRGVVCLPLYGANFDCRFVRVCSGVLLPFGTLPLPLRFRHALFLPR